MAVLGKLQRLYNLCSMGDGRKRMAFHGRRCGESSRTVVYRKQKQRTYMRPDALISTLLSAGDEQIRHLY